MAAPGEIITTPSVVPELPIEVETEVGPAGSLKRVPLWKEIVELLEDPYAFVCDPDDPLTDNGGVKFNKEDESIFCTSTAERRKHFESYFMPDGVTPNPNRGTEVAMPGDFKLFHPCHNVLTGQPLRSRPDGEIDWNQPGYLFDPDETVAVTPPGESLGLVSNIPTELRTPIGILVTCMGGSAVEKPSGQGNWNIGGPCDDVGFGGDIDVNGNGLVDPEDTDFNGNGVIDPADPDYIPAPPDGSLVVSNPVGNGARNQLDLGPRSGPGQGDNRIPPHRTIIAELSCDADGIILAEDEDSGEIEPVVELEQPVNETHFIEDRLAAEVLGKALFWDMQIGSDTVQACGSCHFAGGIDTRTRNQLNPNHIAVTPDHTLQVKGPNENVVAGDFPFHKLDDVNEVGEPLKNPINVMSDANDVMASMGVSEAVQFDDVIVGAGAFNPATLGVAPLAPDMGTPIAEPIASMVDANGNKLRRVEPRNTPTMHSAAFNFDNFWDGRARHDYNGGSVFGPADPFFHIYVNCEEDGEPEELLPLPAPAEAELGPEGLCEWYEEYKGFDDGEARVPVRIRFSSLASQAMGPPLSEFEMAFFGRNWQQLGKKMLQAGVVPLANQKVDPTDSRLGPWANNMGSICVGLGVAAAGKPGLCTTYPELIEMAFNEQLWSNTTQHFNGASVPMSNACEPGEQIHDGEPVLNAAALAIGASAGCDPFDGFVIAVADNPAVPTDTLQFTQMEANFSLFFGLGVQAYEQLLIPDDTPWDRFNDANPMLGNGVAQPGEQGTLPPGVIRELVTGAPEGALNLVAGFGPDELFGFDIFAGGNTTAALAPFQAVDPHSGINRNPAGVGSNPFLRTARCMLCHLGPEQSDHTNNVNAGLLQSGTEIEFPTPPGSPEPTGVLRLVTGLSLAEELEENAQDGVEVENRDFRLFNDEVFGQYIVNGVPLPYNDAGFPFADPLLFDNLDDRVIGQSFGTTFQDNGVYHIGIRPVEEDMLRGGDDPFGFPLNLAALAMKNLGGEDFEPCDDGTDFDMATCDGPMPNFDPALGVGGGLYEAVGDCLDCDFKDGAGNPTFYYQESVNPGLQLEPANPLLPEYLADWANNLPAGEANPLIDELAFAPNTKTHTPVAEYTEILFGADIHCGLYDPATFGAGPPNFGWGPLGFNNPDSLCPNSQTGVPTNMGLGNGPYVPGSLVAPPNGTWPVENRVGRNGAAKASQLRNVEITGPFFHTGSYLTLRQIIDFYMRGGDFPETSREDRDPNLVDIELQAFGFGATTDLPPGLLDGIPDIVTQYGQMPDTNPPGCQGAALNCTPEPTPPAGPGTERERALEDAKEALVKFLLAQTDERVAHKSAPFDQPEIFVPFDGRAPANTFGRDGLVTRSGVPCLPGDDTQGGLDPFSGTCFEQVPETGKLGQATRLPAFLGISRTPVAGPNNDHFDR